MLARTANSALAAVGLRGGEGGRPAILDAVERLKEGAGDRAAGPGRRGRRVPGPGRPGPGLADDCTPRRVDDGAHPEAMRAILAHELAHVRRHDYVVNLAQMAVEALLFFNPAVWWLGRQARVEREACCDAVAVGITGRPLEYSRVLTDWAVRVGGLKPAAPPRWGGRGSAGHRP